MANSNVEVLGMNAWYSIILGLVEFSCTEKCHIMVITLSPVLSMSPHHKEKSAKFEKLNLHSVLPITFLPEHFDAKQFLGPY